MSSEVRATTASDTLSFEGVIQQFTWLVPCSHVSLNKRATGASKLPYECGAPIFTLLFPYMKC